MKRFNVLVVASLLALPAWPHGGEDHGDAAVPALTSAVAPRASAQTEDFELVAVLAQGKLTLYVDRHATNAPVPDAEIEVESGSFKAVAVQVAPGVYSVAGEAFANPGRYPLAISVQAGDVSDLLSATLDLAAMPPAGVAHAHGRNEWAVWGAAGALLLSGAGLIAVRRRKKKHKH